MKVLLIHQGFPGQFVHLLPRLLARGDDVVGMGLAGTKQSERLLAQPRFRWCPYRPARGNGQDVHPLALETESKVLRACWVAEQTWTLRQEGWIPDVVVAHSGWGETMFLDDVWPGVPQLHYLEFAYGTRAPDLGFDPEFRQPDHWKVRARARMKNAAVWLAAETMAWGVSPTGFQRSALPTSIRQRVSIVHDGIDCRAAAPNPDGELLLPNGRRLRPGEPVITFVNRTFEPYRGIHRFLRALPELQRACPEAEIVLIGSDSPKVSYGSGRKDGRGWLTALRDELHGQLNWERIHPLGRVKKATFISALQVSSAHVYFTYPFVLSWSLLEAMAAECLVVGSRTAPVEEVIEHGRNGLLVDFFDTEALSRTLIAALRQPARFKPLRQAARRTVVERFELERCQSQLLRLVDATAAGVLSQPSP